MIRRLAIVAVVLLSGWMALRSAEPPSAAKSPPDEEAIPSLAADTRSIDKVLDAPVTLSFPPCTPLKDVAAKIAAEQHINILLDHRPVADAAIAEDTPISFDVKNCSLRRALHWMLRPHDLECYSPADNLLLITTADAAKLHTTPRLYDIRDLLPKAPSGGQSSGDKATDDEGALVATITSCIAPKSWESAGGTGTIVPGAGTLAVAQTDSVHGQVAGLLGALRRVRRNPAALEPIAVESPAIAAAAATRAKLARRQDVAFPQLQTPIEFPQPLTPLGLRDWLAQRAIPTVLDVKAFADAKIAPDTPLKFDTLKNVPLGWALHQLLSQAGLAYVVDGELLIITTSESAATTRELVVYPVADLLAEESGGDTDEPPYFDRLIDMLCSTVAPQTWDSDGGVGIVSPMPSAKALVVAQTGEVHAKIAKLLADLRTRPPGPKPAPEQLPPANSPVVRVYTLAPPAKGEDAAASQSQRADRYVAVVRDLIEPKSWTDGSGYIAAVPGQIVVRQAPGVQKRVEKLLQDMGAMAGSNTRNSVPSGRGGFGGGAFAVPDSGELAPPAVGR